MNRKKAKTLPRNKQTKTITNDKTIYFLPIRPSVHKLLAAVLSIKANEIMNIHANELMNIWQEIKFFFLWYIN